MSGRSKESTVDIEFTIYDLKNRFKILQIGNVDFLAQTGEIIIRI